MDIFQDNSQGWNDHLNAAVQIFREQMDMILEARNDVAQCQHIIAQQNTQIANLQLCAQGAGPSTAQGPTTTSSYSKKVEIFNDPGEYNGSKVKFKEWWAKMQAWLTVNQHAIPASSQDTVGAVLSRLKGPKADPFAQVRPTQVAQGTYTWTQLVSDVEGLFRTTNKKDWAGKELRELKQ